MTEPSLACQIVINERLSADADVVALVPALQIIDGPSRPEIFPSIIIGTGQTVLEPITVARAHARVILDAHIWHDTGGLEAVKQIAGAATKALAVRPSIAGFRVVDWYVAGTRFMRDPANVGHGVLTVEALLQEAA